jgi:hypothetical protein
MNFMNVPQGRPPSFVAVFASALAAMFGVQSDKNRSRDFAHGRPVHYVLVGIVLTIAFVFGVWMLVKFALSLAGV